VDADDWRPSEKGPQLRRDRYLGGARRLRERRVPLRARRREESQEPAPPAINRESPDYLLGCEGGIQNLRKGLTAEIKNDPVRLAHFEAGQEAGRAEAARGDHAEG
jgi:hypothetical protein